MVNPCFEGWKPEHGNKNGTCCCNCEHQRPINAHPWNKHTGSGSVMETIGYGCISPEFFPHVYFQRSKHGMCEAWLQNKWKAVVEAEEEKRLKEHVWNILTK